MNRPDSLKRTLESVKAQTINLEELIIVDQSTDSRTKDIFDKFKSSINEKIQTLKYFHQGLPSLVKARNKGIRECKSDIVCFIDDDIILFPDYFEKIEGYFEDESIGGITGNEILYKKPSGFKWHLRKMLMRMFLINNYQGKLTASTFGYPIFEEDINKVIPVEIFPGYSMNFRKKFLLNNECDENLSGYSFREDIDLSYRISRQTKLIIVPNARFMHEVSTFNRLNIIELKKMQFQNYFYLFKKFRKSGIFSYVLFYYSIFGIILAAFLESISNLKDRSKYLALRADINAIFYLIRESK